jgi:hypothetical protein
LGLREKPNQAEFPFLRKSFPPSGLRQGVEMATLPSGELHRCRSCFGFVARPWALVATLVAVGAVGATWANGGHGGEPFLETGVVPAPRGIVPSLGKQIPVESLLAAEPGVMARLVGDMVPFGE